MPFQTVQSRVTGSHRRRQRLDPGVLAGVEFVGSPGSGKTTISRALELRLPGGWLSRTALVGQHTLTKRLLLYCLLPFRYPTLCWRLFRLARAGGNRMTLGTLRFCAMFLFYKHRLDQAIRHSDSRVLFDQAFLQIIWSLLHGSRPHDTCLSTMRRVVRTVYRDSPLMIIVLECDERTAAQRVVGRTHGRSQLDGLAAYEIERRISNNSWIMDSLKAALQEAGVACATLDCTAEPGANAEIVMRLLADSAKTF